MHRWAISLSAAVLAGDLITKHFIEATLVNNARDIAVTPFFNLALGYNRGVSFGLLKSDSFYAPYILAAIAVVIAVGLTVWLFRSESDVQKLGLAAIVGGAVGNAVDRLKDGAVTDFLDFYVGTYHWPAFNVADVAIVCGVTALLIEAKRERSNVETSD
tara:strand:- start:399 stop:875 length:477 start_codon:yes stop_codon:yes gene_type:complete